MHRTDRRLNSSTSPSWNVNLTMPCSSLMVSSSCDGGRLAAFGPGTEPQPGSRHRGLSQARVGRWLHGEATVRPPTSTGSAASDLETVVADVADESTTRGCVATPHDGSELVYNAPDRAYCEPAATRTAARGSRSSTSWSSSSGSRVS